MRSPGRGAFCRGAAQGKGNRMKQEYTRSEIVSLLDALQQMFPTVRLADPATGCLLDPATLTPGSGSCRIPVLDSSGRGWLPAAEGEDSITLYRAVKVDGQPCLIVMNCHLPDPQLAEGREANALRRLLSQYHEELSRDYVTGAYNRRYLAESWLPRHAGAAIGIALVRVKEYARICSEYGHDAADCCLNTAAGILQRAAGADPEKVILVRLEDGVFLLAGEYPGAKLASNVREAMDGSRRVFSISLSRRSEFNVAVACADWAETGSWDMLLALAEQRLANA